MSEESFQRYLRQARADPMVLGIVLCGSHAMGLATEHSDFDARTVLRDDASDEDVARYGETTFPGVDAGGGRLADFAGWSAWGSEFAWDRYSYAHARVLHDSTGVITPLVAEKGRIPEEHIASYSRGALDALINSVYRTLKCARRGNALCVRLEATDAIRHALTLLFALEGRHAPYAAYLQHELRTYPLEASPLSGEELIETISAIVTEADAAALQRFFTAVIVRARAAGHGDVVDDWGEDVAWMLSYTPAPVG
jgi:hypothetical protein